MDQKISYKKTRDLGELFNAVFAFVKQNFKPFYMSLLLFAGPFLLAGTVSSTIIVGPVTSILSGLPYGLVNFLSIYFVLLCCIFFGLSIYTVVLNKNIILNETLPEEEKLNLSLISKGFFNDYWRVLLNMFLFGLLILFISGCVAAIFYGFFSTLKEFSESAGLASILVILIVLIVFFFFIPIAGFLPIAAIFVCQRDRITIFSALGKVFAYMKNNFWSTWLFSLVALITYSLAVGVVQIPLAILTFVTTYTRLSSGESLGIHSVSPLMIIATAFSTLLNYAIVAIYYLLNIFHFTNLEEKKEGTRLMDHINQIM